MLNKVEASGLIDELLDTHGGGNSRPGQRQPPQRLRLQRSRNGRRTPHDRHRHPPDPPFTTGLTPWAQTLAPAHQPDGGQVLPRLLAQVLLRAGRLHPEEDTRRPSTSARRCMPRSRRSTWHAGGVRDDSPETIAAAYEKAFSDLERDEGPVNFKDDSRTRESAVSTACAWSPPTSTPRRR